ncbi:MAG: hypothetical protein HKN82_20065 [Akkermansiaceae bacterium]|nr:hypothetical protein [Akkermansiaceae bacterium]NNM28008.1 hypothetical protein [Akkermansiaceae bacterium]
MNQKQFTLPRSRRGPRRSSEASRWTVFDPYWLEAEQAYYNHAHRFPEVPDAPRIIQSPCRPEFFMPVTPKDVRHTLERIPAGFLRELQAIFLLGGTRKQAVCAGSAEFSYGCYWEDCVFLYPFPRELLTSVYRRPPKPSDMQDYARVGAEITTETEGTVVRFDRDSLKRLYLQDVLIHEIGHHVDRENLGPTKENEAYARWFATEFGFRRGAAGRTRTPGEAA